MAKKVVRTPHFETASFLLLMLSTAAVGVQTDMMARQLRARPPAVFQVLDVAFCVFFAVEVLLRLMAYGKSFFFMWGCGWNIFDLFLVITQITEQFLLLIFSEEWDHVLDWRLRIIRVLRSVKVVRVFRMMRFTAGLRLIVSCVLHSVKAFFWAGALLLTLIYVAGTYLTQAVLTRKLDGDLSDKQVVVDLDRFYGNVLVAVLSVFQGLTGGQDWGDLVSPIINHVSPAVGFFYVLFIAFAVLALLNVVTSIFVQNAIERADEVNRLNKVDQARRLFKAVDENFNGCISFEELEQHLEDPVVQQFFRSIDIDPCDAKSLFDLLDFDDSGYLDFEEFLGGCIRLQGSAKALDVLISNRDVRWAFEQQAASLEGVKFQLSELKHSMRDACRPAKTAGSADSRTRNSDSRKSPSMM